MNHGARGVVWRTGTRWFRAALIVVAGMAEARGASAEAAPDEWRSSSYYAVNGAVAVALIGGTALTRLTREGLEAGGDTVWFPGDAGLRGECSPEAAALSDVTVSLAMTLPIGMSLPAA